MCKGRDVPAGNVSGGREGGGVFVAVRSRTAFLVAALRTACVRHASQTSARIDALKTRQPLYTLEMRNSSKTPRLLKPKPGLTYHNVSRHWVCFSESLAFRRIVPPMPSLWASCWSWRRLSSSPVSGPHRHSPGASEEATFPVTREPRVDSFRGQGEEEGGRESHWRAPTARQAMIGVHPAHCSHAHRTISESKEDREGERSFLTRTSGA